ncbi:nitrate- and nitrite sensing domain-containing protein [Streptomyces sp. WM6386]|uniref:sensor histidine kinase n=1 Tax=Streptomyces sp. WM6386 TaxID=1415558 RepID=UPI000698772E|nr:nitrate- and nitrite sensing domain-containing protein [Streptomyces sp. WM6386]
MNSAQLYDNWHSVSNRKAAGSRVALPAVVIFYNLQAERQLSAAALADPAADRTKLAKQRQITDASIKGLQGLSDSAPADIVAHYEEVKRELAQLPGHRKAVDRQAISQQQMINAYSAAIAADLRIFTDFTNVGIARLNVLGQPALDALWGQEALAREDTIFTAGAATGHFSSSQRSKIAELIGYQQHIYNDEVIPLLPRQHAQAYRTIMSSAAWKQKSKAEQTVLGAPVSGTDGRTEVSAQVVAEWRQSVGEVTLQLQQATNAYESQILKTTERELHGLMVTLIVNSSVGALAVLLVLLVSLWFTGVLRRRIFALRSSALELQTRLPDVVERLRRGELVDPDTELPAIRYGTDELGMLGQALNQARSSSLETAVRQVEQYRGFERLLQRIARRTQLLIGMQMKRLGEMERRNEDPEVLEGLFDLDHLAARLRRYEENLVILGGGQPQRRWRKPVLVLDVIRSAQGEVQDYRRIRIETSGRTWLSERAVGPMVHVLAELMENAVMFSKPPTPVEVSATRVGRGLAVEIEDRGLGMEVEQYAEANEMMADPPKMDVMSRSDDARLGLYVVARLAADLGLKVELRPSSFGGTRVVVLVPGELISDEEPFSKTPSSPAPSQLSVVDAPWPGEADHYADHQSYGPDGPHPDGQDAFTRPLIGPWSRPPASAPAPAPAPPSQVNPLPRRVRQASLVPELRVPPPTPTHDDGTPTAPSEPQPPRGQRTEARRAGTTVGAFQRQSRVARNTPDSDHQTTSTSPGPDWDRKDDRR